MSSDPVGVNDAHPPGDRPPELAAISRARSSIMVPQLLSLSPRRVVEPAAWVAHAPFIMWLVERWVPQQTVTLGVGSGNAFFAICEAVQRCGALGSVVGIDTWTDGGHSDDRLFDNLSAEVKRSFGSLATLTRSSRDQAARSFPDGSVDLLYLDGSGGYEALRHDYQHWLPKVSERGIVILHGTQAREPANAGMWRVWSEAKRYYPHCEFPHAGGLGVLFVGQAIDGDRAHVREALVDSAGFAALSGLFVSYGSLLASERSMSIGLAAATADVTRLTYEVESRGAALARLQSIVESVRAERDGLKHHARQADSLESALGQLRQEHDRALASLGQTAAALKEQEQRLSDLSRHGTELRAELAHRSAELADRNSQLQQRSADLAECSAKLADSLAAVEQGKEELLKRDELIAEKALHVDARDAEIALLRSSMAGLADAQRRTVVNLEARLADLHDELHREKGHLEASRADAQVLAQRCSDLEACVSDLRDELARERKRLAAEQGIGLTLRSIVDRRWEERSALFTSRVWRLWEPMREVLTRLLRRPKSVSIRLALADAWAALCGRPPLMQPPARDPLLDVYGVGASAAADTDRGRFAAASGPEPLVGSKSPEYVEYRSHAGASAPVDILAFYLPQFHPIPENDKWWGEGFTEWRNVVRGRPRFPGHYQPKLPGALGYYDLRLPETLQRQAELAQNYGIAGFVFHLYWFGGKRLLEKPLDLFATDPGISLPFCVCWANENWSRRWDGLDADVLIEQQHSPEDDLNFIAEVAKYLRNPRYWRIEGKPLLIVYWANGLPDPKATAARWRDWCRDNGIGEIHLAAVEALSVADPISIGFDSTIEFPPNLMGPPPARGLSPFDPSFSGAIYDYAGLAHVAARPWESRTLRFRGICPSWDNEARKPNRGTVLAGASPGIYQRWLGDLVAHEVGTRPRDRRIIFVNAWNEWAEGACLEPDLRLGYAYLEATRAALSSSDPRAGGRVAVVIHDAHRHGAQLNGMSMAEELERLGYRPAIVLLGDGALKSQMAAVTAVEDWSGFANESARITSAAQALRRAGVETALVNTVVSARVLSALEAAGIRCVVLVHELPQIIQQMGLGAEVSAIASSGCPVVFAHQDVRDRFPGPQERLAGRTFIIPQGIYLKSRFLGRRDDARRFLEDRFGVPQNAPLIINVGFGDHRKGPDLFAGVAIAVRKALPDSRFAWVGALEPRLHTMMMSMLQDAGLAGSLVMPGFTSDVDAFLAGADAMALTSREDPYPSVALEALQHGVPVVAFSGTGGVAALVRTELDSAVCQWDTDAFAHRIVELVSQYPREAMVRVQARMQDECSMSEYASALVHVAQRQRGGVSVIVPNYNYAKYIESRLDSIVAQGDVVREIIFLDDASNDGSVDTVRSWCRSRGQSVRLIVNHANSGNVTVQWARGARLATSDFIWIAEADDLAEPGMMSRLMQCMQDPEVVLAYCESRGIDEAGTVTMPDYRQWLSDLDGERWSRSWVSDGREEVARYLCIKNTIPNVSAALFRREVLVDALARVLPVARSSRSCGDWLTYCEVLMRGRLAFVAEPLNLHRRHSRSVIGALSRQEIAREIEGAHAHIRELVPVTPERVAKAAKFVSSVR